MGSLEGGIKIIIGQNPDLGPVYMEASYPARRVTRPGGTNKRSIYMEPSYMIAAWRRNGAKTEKGVKLFETLKNITKYSESKRISAEQFRKTYLSIRMYFWAIIFQWQSTYILSRAAKLPGRPSYPGKVFTWKIFIWPRRDPASFCRELAKASYLAASCKQSPGITISFYNSRDLAVAE
jgi:hypothetical protein